MVEFMAVMSGLVSALQTISNIADGRQNGVHGISQLGSTFGSTLGSLVGGK